MTLGKESKAQAQGKAKPGCVPLEPLRFNFKPRALRLLLAALADPGPASRSAWSLRSGVRAGHLSETMAELSGARAIDVKLEAEGIKILVQPVEFWRERPICRRDVWIESWANVARQSRLDLVSEAPGLTDALANVARGSANVDPGLAADVAGRVSESVNDSVNNSLPKLGSPPQNGEIPQNGERPSTTRAGRHVKRNDVLKENVGTFNAEDSVNNLRERVRQFVGDRDWSRYWSAPRWSRIFDEPERAALLDGALSYLKAGIADGSVRIRLNNGAALWEEFGRAERERLKAITQRT